MSSFLYFLAQYYPFWAIPLAFIHFELALHFRRANRKFPMVAAIGIAVVLVILAGLYFYNNGFQTLIPAMQEMEQKYRTNR